MSLIYNATFDKNTRKLSFEDRAGNEIYSFTVPERGPAVDDITKPLTFKATQDVSTVSLAKNRPTSISFQTSTDGGNTWANYTPSTVITLNIGDEVSFRAKEDRTSAQATNDYFQFKMTGKIEAWHNVMSLYRTSDFATYDTVVSYAFFRLFYGCTSLTKAPALPAIPLASSCYQAMFNGCTSLTKAPVLPVTKLSAYCYAGMFNGCTSLTEAPELPATTLTGYCYHAMFKGCTSLTKAPELPATTLANNCYSGMFYGCGSLNEVRCKIPSTIRTEDIPTYTGDGSSTTTYPWLEGVASTGTFYTNADANWPSGDSGIPTGWTRVNEGAPSVDDITKPLTFRATQDGSTVKLTKNGSSSDAFQTSRDGGNTWSDYTLDTAITLNTGEEVSFRAKADRTSSDIFQFVMTGKIEAWHNVMSMLRTNDFATYNTVVSHAFRNLFRECTSLTKAPILPATTLAYACCSYMFYGCTLLTEAPELPATTLAQNCYCDMFERCTSLTKAPELPATTLAQNCYLGMFSGCTSLTKAPELPATTLASDCYGYMFEGCSSLNEVRCQMPSSYSSYDISSNYAKSWLEGVASTGTFYTNADAKWPSGVSGIPTGWTRVNERAKDDSTKPLTFKATQDGSSVTLKKKGSPTGSFQTSTDGGNTWSDYTLDTAIALNTGDEVSFRAKANRTSAPSMNDYFQFVMTGKIEAWDNVMSMIRTNDFATYDTVVDFAFCGLFEDCTSLTKAPVLPATTLANSCYKYMFYGCQSLTKAPELPATTLTDHCYGFMFPGCTSLTEAPELPATTLANYCYQYMFSGCTSLTKAPVLPATTLGDYCYESMFRGCTSLTEAPVLPATTLANNCYGHMFGDCTSLTKAPVLPATTLRDYCYENMFSGCTSLTKAPELPATTLTDHCYYAMFNGCTSLTKAPVLPVTTLAQYCYQYMFNGCSTLNEVRCQMPSSYSSSSIGSNYAKDWLANVSSTGTFYTNADANWPSGASGIPTGWTRINT